MPETLSESFGVKTTTRFEKQLKRLDKKYPSLKKEYSALVASLEDNPRQGTPIGSSCYKIRLAISSKGAGKSSGLRVITLVVFARREVFLVAIYDKSIQTNIDSKELLKSIRDILGDYATEA